MTNTLAEIAGHNARALRQQAHVELGYFARAMRRNGLAWSTGRVGDFESGRAAATLETLYVVALALRDVTGRDVTLADLFAGKGPVRINGELTTQLHTVRAALAGKPVATVRLSARAPRPTDDFVEADFRLCKRVGVEPDVGAAAMRELWDGRTFTAERDRRAGSDAKPQHRGQIARQLRTELQAGLTGHGDLSRTTAVPVTQEESR